MKKLFALLAIALLPLTAAAHGPSPQKVEKSVTIKAEPAKVWALVKDFGNWQKWHPAVTNTKLDIEQTGDAVVSFPNTTVADLVEGLNRARVNTRRTITILQAVKTASALHADIIVQ